MTWCRCEYMYPVTNVVTIPELQNSSFNLFYGIFATFQELSGLT